MVFDGVIRIVQSQKLRPRLDEQRGFAGQEGFGQSVVKLTVSGRRVMTWASGRRVGDLADEGGKRRPATKRQQNDQPQGDPNIGVCVWRRIAMHFCLLPPLVPKPWTI
jgi:hypothetical protein